MTKLTWRPDIITSKPLMTTKWKLTAYKMLTYAVSMPTTGSKFQTGLTNFDICGTVVWLIVDGQTPHRYTSMDMHLSLPSFFELHQWPQWPLNSKRQNRQGVTSDHDQTCIVRIEMTDCDCQEKGSMPRLCMEYKSSRQWPSNWNIQYLWWTSISNLQVKQGYFRHWKPILGIGKSTSTTARRARQHSRAITACTAIPAYCWPGERTKNTSFRRIWNFSNDRSP